MSNNVRNPTTESNLNFLDRAIAIFSPQIAYERMRFRNALNNGHKAGGQSASRANWTPIIGTGESINKISRDRMRARAGMQNGTAILLMAFCLRIGGIS